MSENTLTASDKPGIDVSADDTETVNETDSDEPKAPEPEKATDEKADASEPKSDSDEDKSEPKPKPESRSQKRIKQLVRDRDDRDREIQRLVRENEELRQQAPLNEDDFSDHAQYQAALHARYADIAALNRRARDLDEKRKQDAAERVEAWNEVVAEAKATMPDFDSVFTDAVPVSQVMVDTIMESDDSAGIAYWLGKNRDESARIAKLPAMSAAREIGRIEARLSAPKPKTVSSAPKPVETVGGKAHATVKDPAKMSYTEYKAWRMGSGAKT